MKKMKLLINILFIALIVFSCTNKDEFIDQQQNEESVLLNEKIYCGTLSPDQSTYELYYNEDVLLSFSQNIKGKESSDMIFADLDFSHGLAKAKIVVNIKGFVNTSSATDIRTT